VVVFPNCKINLGLHITRKREDGFHDLETVFYPLPLRDALEIVRNRVSEAGSQPSAIQLTTSGLTVNGEVNDNLCIKAYRLLQKDFPGLPPVQMHLHKTIPMGAGLGGGSADGAFTLRLLNEQFQLALSTEQLLDYAIQLGSDCPFFIINQPCLATGRGELLQKIEIDLSAWRFLLIHPGIHIPTVWAFEQLKPAPAPVAIREIIQQPFETWRSALVNDFEEPVCQAWPALQSIKQQLYDAGAIYASMTGSGSCFFGMFSRDPLPDITWPKEYKVWSL
jgi:4-diphosphocytidyl-2-C-methyl-D-erythritol kinase